jgi:hypothetical protein
LWAVFLSAEIFPVDSTLSTLPSVAVSPIATVPDHNGSGGALTTASRLLETVGDCAGVSAKQLPVKKAATNKGIKYFMINVLNIFDREHFRTNSGEEKRN